MLFISNRTHRGGNLLVLEKKITQQKQSFSKNNLTKASKFNILEKYVTINLMLYFLKKKTRDPIFNPLQV